MALGVLVGVLPDAERELDGRKASTGTTLAPVALAPVALAPVALAPEREPELRGGAKETVLIIGVGRCLAAAMVSLT